MESSIPIIRLEVERMKHTMITALSQHQLRIDEDLRAAVERFCEPEHLGEVIESAVNEQLTDAIQKEIKHFFAYGDGRKAIQDAVIERLRRDIKRDAMEGTIE